MSKVVIIPAGQWGTALAVPLRDNGHEVDLRLQITDIENISDADFIILSPTSAIFRKTVVDVLSRAHPDAILISVTKGLEESSLMRTSEVIEEVSPQHAEKFTVVSGPSFAEEVADRKPTLVVAASRSEEASKKVQELFATENFRVYRTDDVTGVELGGVLKNIVALATGISDGMGYGDNARAALITRSFREMLLLAKAEGAQEKTLCGLSGIGDLILTCTSPKSRNYCAGVSIGKVGCVENKEYVTLEGIQNVQSVLALCERNQLDLPLFREIAMVVTGQRLPQEALREIMIRPLKDES